MTDDREPIARLEALAAEVDRRFAEIQERHAGRMECRAGCSACCRARLSITRVEQEVLERGLARLDPDRRAELSRRTREPGRETCPALDDDGRCGVYAFRPLICRSFGVPLRRRSEVPLVRPPTLDACDLNFVGTPLRTLPAEDAIDQTALDAEVDAIDRVHCERNGLPLGERVPIASILG